MKKLLLCLMMIMTCFSVTGGIFAESYSKSNLIDIRTYKDVYKMSNDSDVNLPFIKTFEERATYDKLIGSSGLSVAGKGIDIKNELRGVQTIISGDTVTITGKLEYANIIADNVVIEGEISKDVLIMAEGVVVKDTAKIGGDFICTANTIELSGNIAGNVIFSSKAAEVSANIGKDFRAVSESLEISGSTAIKGNIYIETDSALNILGKYPNATIKKYDNAAREITQKQSIKDMATKGILLVLSYGILYYIIKKLNKNVMTKYSNKVKTYPTFTILMGFASLFLIPIGMIITLIGCAFGLGVVLGPLLILWIALTIAVLWLALFITGVIIFESIVPKLIKGKEENKNSKWAEAGILLLVFAVLYTLTKVPGIGSYVNAFTVLAALGSVVTNMFKKEKIAVEVKEK